MCNDTNCNKYITGCINILGMVELHLGLKKLMVELHLASKKYFNKMLIHDYVTTLFTFNNIKYLHSDVKVCTNSNI